MKKSAQGLYAVDSTTLDQEAYQRSYGSVLKPLNLFEVSDDEDSDVITLGVKNYRPITPIQDAVKESPKDLEAFCHLVRERLPLINQGTFISVEDQRELVTILIAELKTVWPDVRKQPPDPFLNNDQNKELYRRVAIEIVTRLSEIFKRYIGLAKEFNKMGVFSSKANISRLKTQIAEESAKSLNILKVRRKVLLDMANEDKMEKISEKDSYIGLIQNLVGKENGALPANGLNTTQQAAKFYRSFELNNLQKKLDDINIETKQYNVDDFGKRILKSRAKVQEGTGSSSATSPDQSFKNKNETIPEDSIYESKNATAEAKGCSDITEKSHIDQGRSLKKSTSCRELILKDDIFEDFNLDVIKNERRTSVHKLRALYESESEEEEMEESDSFLAKDLDRLVNLNDEDDELQNENIPLDDLPPLLQVYQKKKPKKKRIHDAKSSTSVRAEDSEIDPLGEPNICDEDENAQMESKNSQPDVISSTNINKGVTRTYNVRVSSRIFKSGITLQSYPAIYNEFKGEIDESATKQLDSHLFAGDELKEVYDEILGTLAKKHMDFDKDTYVEKCLEAPLPAERALSTLSQSKFYGGKNAQDIPSCPVYQPRDPKCTAGPFSSKLAAQKDKTNTKGGKQSAQRQDDDGAKTYTSWLAWWRTAISTEDYYKYLCLQDTDFLSTIFRLEELKEETEASEGRKSKSQKRSKNEREQRPVSETMMEKTKFVNGFWNPRVVLLGGLGRDPDNANWTSESAKGEVPLSSSFTQRPAELTSTKLSVRLPSAFSHLSVPGKSSSHLSQQTVRTDTDTQQSGLRISTVMSDLPSTPNRGKLGRTRDILVSEPPSMQTRLDKIWTALKMTDNDRLDMALKYSTDEHLEDLPKVVDKLEIIAQLVSNRENALADLEKFERTASDPNRFFEKGPRGLSNARQQEEFLRRSIHKKLSSLEKKIRNEITRLGKHFGDDIKYEGRPYLQKMDNDKVEMLFWLQQERRKDVLYESTAKHKEKLLTVELPAVKIESIL